MRRKSGLKLDTPMSIFSSGRRWKTAVGFGGRFHVALLGMPEKRLRIRRSWLRLSRNSSRGVGNGMALPWQNRKTTADLGRGLCLSARLCGHGSPAERVQPPQPARRRSPPNVTAREGGLIAFTRCFAGVRLPKSVKSQYPPIWPPSRNDLRHF